MEYYFSMLIRRFVSLRVAGVKSYHARSKVELDATLHKHRELIQTDRSTCLRNIPCIIYIFHKIDTRLISKAVYFNK